MKKTQAAEVVHLYLGCKLLYKDSESVADFIYCDQFTKDRMSNFKLILRPLSSMTNEEDKECHNIMLGEFEEKVQKQSIVHYEAEKIKYLLSKGFDLFGLIEGGQAINGGTIVI